jgi:hypothetical protein
MKLSLLIIITILFLIGCRSHKHSQSDIINIDDAIPQSAQPLNEYIHRERGDSLRAYDYKFNGNHFKLGADSKESIQWILVMDSVYATPEGVHMGDKGTKALAIGEPMGKWYQGYYQVRLPSGWIAQIEGGGSFDKRYL